MRHDLACVTFLPCITFWLIGMRHVLANWHVPCFGIHHVLENWHASRFAKLACVTFCQISMRHVVASVTFWYASRFLSRVPGAERAGREEEAERSHH
jgi:hypothetical protein